MTLCGDTKTNVWMTDFGLLNIEGPRNLCGGGVFFPQGTSGVRYSSQKNFYMVETSSELVISKWPSIDRPDVRNRVLLPGPPFPARCLISNRNSSIRTHQQSQEPSAWSGSPPDWSVPDTYGWVFIEAQELRIRTYSMWQEEDCQVLTRRARGNLGTALFNH